MENTEKKEEKKMSFQDVIETLADIFETDAKSREQFKDVLAITIQDELDRDLADDEVLELTGNDIVVAANVIAENFTKTIENQND
jgi:hypothetical protein